MKSKELKIEQERTDELVTYRNNAKIHTGEQIEQIKKSIQDFGFNDPIAVWTNADGKSEIVEGHGRLFAAQELGMEYVPVIHLDTLTDEQRRAYTHVHNQLTLNSGFDAEMLLSEFMELPEIDWDAYGFDAVEYEGDYFEDVDEEEPPAIEFGDRLDEENNYIVLKFTNDIDWINAQSIFDIKPAKRYSTRADGLLTDSMTMTGIGRVIDGAAAINRLIGEVDDGR